MSISWYFDLFLNVPYLELFGFAILASSSPLHGSIRGSNTVGIVAILIVKTDLSGHYKTKMNDAIVV